MYNKFIKKDILINIYFIQIFLILFHKLSVEYPFEISMEYSRKFLRNIHYEDFPWNIHGVFMWSFHGKSS